MGYYIEYIHHVVLIAIKKIILASRFLPIFANEITIVDNKSWISMHCYVVASWRWVPILFTFECLVESGIATNIKSVILVAFITMVVWPMKKLLNELLLGVNGVSMFQGVKLGLIVLPKTQQAPYLIKIHCMANQTNLVVQSLSSMLMVSKLENVLQSLYGYFFSFPKHHLEFTKLVEIVEIKGLKVFWNAKTRWINMLALLKRVGKEYNTF